jgi:hypothetical protein
MTTTSPATPRRSDRASGGADVTSSLTSTVSDVMPLSASRSAAIPKFMTSPS